MFSYIDALQLQNSKIISIIGSGGKTTTMFHLASEYATKQEKVLILTTTHIMCPNYSKHQCVLFYPLKKEDVIHAFSSHSIVILGSKCENGKLSSIPYDFLKQIASIPSVILCEADGSKHMPLKYHASYEPVLLPGSDTTLIVSGLNGLHKPFSECCHRFVMACEYIKKDPADLVTNRDFCLLLYQIMENVNLKCCSNLRILLTHASDCDPEDVNKILDLLRIKYPHILCIAKN